MVFYFQINSLFGTKLNYQSGIKHVFALLSTDINISCDTFLKYGLGPAKCPQKDKPVRCPHPCKYILESTMI